MTLLTMTVDFIRLKCLAISAYYDSTYHDSTYYGSTYCGSAYYGLTRLECWAISDSSGKGQGQCSVVVMVGGQGQ